MNLKRLLCVVLVLAVMFGVDRWLYVPEWQRRYSQVVGGMTVDQVRQVMGRSEDREEERKTTTGEFEHSWTFVDGVRLTVVFDKTGRSTYKEFAPSFCGVTPLMGKY